MLMVGRREEAQGQGDVQGRGGGPDQYTTSTARDPRDLLQATIPVEKKKEKQEYRNTGSHQHTLITGSGSP